MNNSLNTKSLSQVRIKMKLKVTKMLKLTGRTKEREIIK